MDTSLGKAKWIIKEVLKKKNPRPADWVIPRSFASFFKLFVLSKSSQVAGADFHDCFVLPKFKILGFTLKCCISENSVGKAQ